MSDRRIILSFHAGEPSIPGWEVVQVGGDYTRPPPIPPHAKLGLFGFSAGCQAVRAHLLAGVKADLVVCVDGIAETWPTMREDRLDMWRRLADEARRGERVFVLTHTRQTYTEKRTPPFASTLTTARAISGLPLAADGETRVREGGFAVWSYPSQPIDDAAHRHQGQAVGPEALRYAVGLLDGVDREATTPRRPSSKPPGRPTLRRGASGPYVVEWQRVVGVTPDGAFGPKTEAATKAWQVARGLPDDGVVGPASWAVATRPVAAAADDPTVTSFVQARSYTRGPRRGRVELVVIHDMEAAESTKTAENVAAWFAGASAPKASAHFCVDSDSTVQCVREADVAWHAPGANHNGIGVELAGYARQTAEEWADPFSTAMLERAAKLVAGVCRRHDLPVAFVDAAGLLRGERGITTHAEVSKAFKRSTHYDPGNGFPMTEFLVAVQSFREG